MSEEEKVNNPFKFSALQLAELVDPKNPELLKEYGGLQGIAEALKVDVKVGLPIQKPEETEKFADREAVFGRNVLPATKTKGLLELMWIALHDKIMIILSIAAIVSLSVGLYEDFGPGNDPDEPKVHWIEGVAILISVFIVITAGSINDYQKEKQFQALNAKKDDRKVKALRGGENVVISVFDVEVGDVLLLEPGDLLCSDGIFIQGHNLKCDESAATGESDTIEKSHDKDVFILSGSKVTEGVGTYLVTAVGVNSFNGKTMMSLRTENEDTPLQVKLNGLAEKIAVIGSSAAILMFIILIVKYIIVICTNDDDNDVTFEKVLSQVVKIFISAITVVVVAVPEGLPLAVTLALAFATTRMLKDNNLVRVLNACETMGGATTVCSDKTGTLTQNKMTVVKGVVGKHFGFEDMNQIKSLKDDLKKITGTTDANNKEIKDGAELLDCLVEGISINSTAFEGIDEHGEEGFVGSKTETALLGMTKSMEIDYKAIRNAKYIETVQVYPFSSAKKSMATIIKIDRAAKGTGSGYLYRVHVKGASEIILRYSSKALLLPEGGFKCGTRSQPPAQPSICPVTQRLRDDFNTNIIERFANESLRTIGLAYREFEEDEFKAFVQGELKNKVIEAIREEQILQQKREMAEKIALERGIVIEEENLQEIMNEISDEQTLDDLPPIPELTEDDILSHNSALGEIGCKDLTFMCIVGIEDPVRPGVPEAVEACKHAGVVVRMVTGDNINTARAIATKCGIYTKGGIVMEGPVFRKLSDEEMDRVLPRLQVLARSSPTDKQILVGRLKYLGETVAVTGDGTNDGPALKMADVGFSMGIAGTEVAKEASAIILMDDNFSSIVKAILWGRSVNDSVKKFLQFQLTVNVTAVVITFISAIFDGENGSALTAVQLLWVNLIMDTLAALALATEKPTHDMLERPPQNKKSPLISPTMWKMIVGQSIFQVIINFSLLFLGPYIFSNWLSTLKEYGGVTSSGPHNNNVLEKFPGLTGEALTQKVHDEREIFDEQNLILKTMIFNTFVFLQIFNEVNCRRIDNHLNIFEGIHRNAYFICIFIFIAVAQVIIVTFGGDAFKTIKLNIGQWAICVLLGALSIPLGVLIRLVPDQWVASCLPKGAPEAEPVDFDQPLPDFLDRNSTNVSATERSANAQVQWKFAISSIRNELHVFDALHGGRTGASSPNAQTPRISTSKTGSMGPTATKFTVADRAMTAPIEMKSRQAWKRAMSGIQQQRKLNNEV